MRVRTSCGPGVHNHVPGVYLRRPAETLPAELLLALPSPTAAGCGAAGADLEEDTEMLRELQPGCES